MTVPACLLALVVYGGGPGWAKIVAHAKAPAQVIIDVPGKKFVESKAANGAAKVECSAVAHGVLPQKDGKPVPQPQKSDFAYTDGNSGGDNRQRQ